MSNTIDNITLALFSLKQSIKSYLDSNGWSKRYSIFVESDESIYQKELVEKVTNPQTQIGLPVIIIETGTIRTDPIELGDYSGTDVVYLSIIVKCANNAQQMSLGNVVRRYVNSLQFSVYDPNTPGLVSLGTALCQDAVLDDISDPNSDLLSERYNSLINVTLEINAQQLT